MTRRATFLINSLRGGGAERVCVTLANELAAMGWTVEVLVLNLRDAVMQVELTGSVAVTNLNVSHARNCGLKLWRYVTERSPEVFLVFNHQLAIVLLLIRRLARADFRIVARSISTLSRKRLHQVSFWHRQIVDDMTRAFYKHVDKVVAQSEGMKHDLTEHYGFSADEIIVIHNPLARRFEQCPLSEIGPWSRRPWELIYVGRLNSIKGLDLLLRAFAVCARDNAALTLRLIGDGDQRAVLGKLADKLGMSGRIVFEGFVSDIVPFYRRARATLLTSHYEGFPNVLVESLSQGTPIVAVNCASGPSEIVVEGVNGFLVSGRDHYEFARVVSRALETDWDSERIRAAASLYFRQNVARRYEAILNELTGRGLQASSAGCRFARDLDERGH